MDIILDSFLDALKDSLIALPFLFLAYLLIEALERHTDLLTGRFFKGSGYFAPALGSLFGLIPQCGFSSAMSNLYVSGIIGEGALIATFLATSDEAVLIMLSSPGSYKEIIKLLLTKLIIAFFFGYLLTFILRKKKAHEANDICSAGHCGCENSKGIVKPALIHTAKIIGWIFGITFALNIVIELIGTDALAAFLGGNLFIQPLITALLGLIPNCAVSVLFTELYLSGSLGFASAVSGLCSGAGVGLIVLFKMNKNKKECFFITFLLYACAAVSGIVLQPIPL